MIDFDDYQKVALTTAKYPSVGSNIYYPALGLAGETGEVLEKVAELVRAKTPLTLEEQELLSKEIGDVLWYAATLAHEMGLDLSEVTTDPGVDTFQATRTLRDSTPALLALDLGGSAGAVLERVKKVMRDQDGVLDDASRERLRVTLFTLLENLAVLASNVNVDLAAAAQQNADKLADRLRRSVISGDGDTR